MKHFFGRPLCLLPPLASPFAVTCVALCLVLGLGVTAQAAESANHAQRIAVEVLKQHAERLPSHAEHLNELALGLHAGSVSLAEAEQVLRIIQLLQRVSHGADARAASPQAAQTQERPVATVSPQDVLAALDAPTAPSPATSSQSGAAAALP